MPKADRRMVIPLQPFSQLGLNFLFCLVNADRLRSPMALSPPVTLRQ